MRPFALLSTMSLLACSETSAPVTAPMSGSSASPVASVREAPAASGASGASGSSCLMLHVCGCNLGCARIAIAPSTLNVGAQAKVEKGPLLGETVKVVEEPDTSGRNVLALTDLHHDFACESAASQRSLMAYACESSKSGPIPANACAQGCD